MKLEKIIIKNFRCYREQISIPINSMTAIIARNDVGKSSILEAIDAFFNAEKLEADDRSKGLRASDNVEISCIFIEIPEQLIIDTDNLISPSNEYLLNSNRKLEIRKVFSGAALKCDEIYIHALHPTAANFDDLLSLTIAQLRARARLLGVNLNGVNETVKSALRHAIWMSVPDENLEKVVVELEIKTSIWKSLQNILPMFQLFKSDRPSSDQDAEAQDPIKFAIKEALKQKAAELEIIGEHVKQQVKAVTDLTIEKLGEMDPELASQLDSNFSAFNWSKVFSVSLTNENQIPLNKRGSGVRRLFLINFFRAKAEQLRYERDVQDVIYAIEEPETSQHPNNQLLLLSALKELALEDFNQVIFTTHNPVLVGRVDRKSIRFIEKLENGSRVLAENDDNTLMKIRESLGMFANHNIKIFVGVEGPNDIEYFNELSTVLSEHNPEIINLRNAEALGELVYIPMGGSTLELWTNRLEGLLVPEVHVLDRDNPPTEPARYQAAADRVNARGDNCCSFITNRREMENYIHFESINQEFNLQLTTNFQPFDDVPSLVAKAVHEASEAQGLWEDLEHKKRSEKESRAKKRLNRGAIKTMTIERLNNVDTDGEVLTWLSTISAHLR